MIRCISLLNCYSKLPCWQCNGSCKLISRPELTTPQEAWVGIVELFEESAPPVSAVVAARHRADTLLYCYMLLQGPAVWSISGASLSPQLQPMTGSRPPFTTPKPPANKHVPGSTRHGETGRQEGQVMHLIKATGNNLCERLWADTDTACMEVLQSYLLSEGHSTRAACRMRHPLHLSGHTWCWLDTEC